MVRHELSEQYRLSLRDFLSGVGESALQRAYELGRQAISEGMGVLEMAAIHREALERVMLNAQKPEPESQAVKAMEFLGESLSPFEMTHRAFRDANTALHRLNQMLEDEAKRIAHALHDEAGQLLASAHIALEDAAGKLPPPFRDTLNRVQELLDLSEEQLRSLAHELRPTILDDLGLVPALEFLAQGVSRRSKLSITVRGSIEGRVPPIIETALYRIVREALTNVVKHGQATRASIHVHRKDQERIVRCSIRDNGVGLREKGEFPKGDERGFGLIGIRERIDALRGTFQISSSPGDGTELVVIIPVGVQDAASNSSGR
ncbi:MAG TPA: ATP-binding protein [Nitrospiria bacterium]|nr:ATP-binding protein [Nitrospiria bacterium]